MLRMNFSRYQEKYPELAKDFRQIQDWTRRNKNADYIDFPRLLKETPDAEPSRLARALVTLVNEGVLRIVFGVKDPRYRTLSLDGFFDKPTDIPPRLRDIREDKFDASEGDIVTIYKGKS